MIRITGPGHKNIHGYGRDESGRPIHYIGPRWHGINLLGLGLFVLFIIVVIVEQYV